MKSDQQFVAVIYCRVSSVAQMQKGHGLASQETRCREFARLKGYEVVQVFTDGAVSGGMTDRPGIRKMLAYLRKEMRNANFVVLIDDISRLARDIKAHIELRYAIASTGASLESPSIEFGEDSDSVLVENLLACTAQHQRQKNAEQTKNRMRARLMNGYWPFIPCLGLRGKPKPGEGKVLARVEPYASIIQEALEGFASGRFQTQSEVKRFLESFPEFPRDRKGEVRYQKVLEILTCPLYAGYVVKDDWGISLRKGRHEGLIDFETFERIQARINGHARMPARADIRSDFPLRGAVTCAECGKPLTANWSTSKTKSKHPYYMCFAKGCGSYRKSIRRDQIEGAFAELLENLTPAPALYDLVRAMFKDAWSQRLAQAGAIAKSYKTEVAKLEKQIEGLMDRIVDAGSQSVIAAYEKRIGQLERNKLVLQEKASKSGKPQGTFEELFELAFRFLSSPSKLWHSGKLEYQKLVLRLTFADQLAYCRTGGFRTPKTTLPFNILGDRNMAKSKMAETETA